MDLKAYQTYLRQLGKSPSTVSSYVSDAWAFLNFLQNASIPIQSVEISTLEEFQNFLKQDRAEKPNSIRRTIIGARQFFRYLVTQNVIIDSPLDMYPIPKRIETERSKIDLTILEDLLHTARGASPAIKSLRDQSLLCLLGYEGIKASELVGLKWSQLVISGNLGSLRISGTRSRIIELTGETTSLLRSYREAIQELDSLYSQKNMFVAFKGRNSKYLLSSLSRHGLKFTLYEIGATAGIDHLNSEDLRHCAIQHQLALGKSTEEVLRHLGLKRPGLISIHVPDGTKALMSDFNSM